jgi:hypothetical protein
MVGMRLGMGRGGSFYRQYFNTEKERGVRRATEKDSIALRAGYVAGGVRKWLSGPKRCVRGLCRFGSLARPSEEARGSIGHRKGAARPIGLDASVALCGPRSSSVLRSSRCRPYGRPVSGTIGRAAAGGAA